MPRSPHPSDDLALGTLAVVIAVLAVLFLLSGCFTTVTRLNPGECLVIVEGDQVVTAGKGCEVRRFSR